MRYLRQYINLLFLFLLFGSCSNDQVAVAVEDEPLAYKEVLNVSYGSSPQQQYDLFLPANRTLDTKVMILVHGGGWTSGDKSDMAGITQFLSEQLPALAIVNMNYRLADESNPPYPMQLEDISAVVDEISKKRSSYQIGSDIGFIGLSAGGHLSLLWTYAFDLEKKVKMVCSIVGPTNLKDEAYLNSTNEVLVELIQQFGTDPALLETVSPLFHVTADVAPTILFYGALDPLVPSSQGLELSAKLEEFGVINEFTLYPNGRHGWIGSDLLDTTLKLKAFIDKQL